MSEETKDRPVVVGAQKAPKPAPMPVIRLVSRPCIGIINGRLAAVFELLPAAA